MKKHATLLETKENVEKAKKEVGKKITNKKKTANAGKNGFLNLS